MTSRTLEADRGIIFDNTVLSNFALVQAFDILLRLYASKSFVCGAVLQEITLGIESGWKYPQLLSRTRLQAITQAIEDGWLMLPPINVNLSDKLLEERITIEYGQRFGAGEAESMALARTRNWVFASDDSKARQFSQEQGIQVTGTLGILVKATSLFLIDLPEADALHTHMIDEGYRSPLPYRNGISSLLRR